MKQPGHSTIAEVEKYLRQQAEIYGKEYFVDPESIFPAPEVKVVQVQQTTETTLDGFYQTIKKCSDCNLATSRNHLVFGTGNRNAALMCIGEAPGYDEDQNGQPFVGAAGKLLDKILAAIRFARNEVYITNIIKCRPPGNRDPNEEEIAKCRPHLERQIELVKPKLILALGRVAAHALLGTQEALGELRKRTHIYGNSIKVVVTYHPAALLRNSKWKKPTWEDVQNLRQLYDELVG